MEGDITLSSDPSLDPRPSLATISSLLLHAINGLSLQGSNWIPLEDPHGAVRRVGDKTARHVLLN